MGRGDTYTEYVDDLVDAKFESLKDFARLMRLVISEDVNLKTQDWETLAEGFALMAEGAKSEVGKIFDYCQYNIGRIGLTRATFLNEEHPGGKILDAELNTCLVGKDPWKLRIAEIKKEAGLQDAA